MGSTSRRGDGLSFFKTKRTHFFKIILDDILREGKLGIPRKFVKRYGSSIPNLVHLKVPSGKSWLVEVSKHGNDVWFQSGWQEFVEYYSLDYGHLLVFEHDGGSSFHVLIFDKTATEIKYPTICSKEPKQAGPKREPVKESVEDGASVKIMEDFSISCRARKRSSTPFPRRRKKARNDSTSQRKSTSMPLPNFGKISSASKIPKEFGGVVQPTCQKEIAASSTRMPCWRTKVVRREQLLACQKKSEALQRARAFESEHPHFLVVMKPSYISRTVGLAIPATFCRAYFGKKLSDVSLCVSDGRKWFAKYTHHANQSSGRLFSGWEGFVRDNSLRVGDACVFELIGITKIKLRVSIFRVVENPNIDLSLGGKKAACENSERKKKRFANVEALERAIALSSGNPYFMVIMHPTYIRRGHGLSIPAAFARKYLTDNQSGVTLCVHNGRTWCAQHKRKGNRSSFYYGWHEFVEGNGLKVGDVCIFELIKDNEFKLKVSIVRGDENTSSSKRLENIEAQERDDEVPKRDSV